MTQLELFPQLKPGPFPILSLQDHMRACTSVGCLRCAGANLPHFGQEPPKVLFCD